MTSENVAAYFSRLSQNSKTIDTTTLSMEEIFAPAGDDVSHFAENVDFLEDIIAVAPHGGSIAVASSKSVTIGVYNPNIDIYDPCLHFVYSIHPQHTKKLVSIYLTPEEMLVCIHDDSTICVYDQRGHLITKKKIITVEGEFINFVSFWENGAFIVTFNGRIFYVEDFSRITVTEYPQCKDYELRLGTVSPPHTIDGVNYGCALWAAASKGSDDDYLVLIQASSVQAQSFPRPIRAISFSGTSSLAAIASEHSILIYDSTFTTANVEVRLEDTQIRSINWCGDDVVIVTSVQDSQFKAIAVGSSTDGPVWDFQTGFVCTTEVDGSRFISKNKVLYLTSVPKTALSFLNSEDFPGKQLYDSTNDRRTSAMRDRVSELGDKLKEATDACIEAAKYFRNSDVRASFLSVVAHTKYRLPSYDCDYAKVIESARLCGFLSRQPYYMPMTFPQLNALGLERLLMRLCNRFMHFHAFKIADYVNEKPDTIYTHWASCLVRSGANSELIIQKIQQSGATVDFTELAEIAYDVNREDLAKALLDCNPVKSRSVPLLLERGQWSEAVESAIQSNDTSLILFVLRKAVEEEKQDVIAGCLTKHPIALDAWLSINSEEKRVELLKKGGRIREAICAQLEEAVRVGNGDDEVLAEAKSAKDSLSESITERYIKAKNWLRKIGKPEWEILSPYDVLEKVINEGMDVKDAAKALGISKGEVFWRKVAYMTKTDKSTFAKDLAESGNEQDLGNLVQHLMDLKKDSLAKMVISNIADAELAQRMNEIMQKMEK